MNTQKQTHRWLVAAPIAALVLALSMAPSLMSQKLAGDVASAVSENQMNVSDSIFQIEKGTEIDASDEARVVLNEGTVLIGSRIVARLSVGEFELLGWNGGYQVTKAGDSITVAALTTPVFVRHGNSQTVVPAFMQWKAGELISTKDGAQAWYASREPKMLPQEFIKSRLQMLDAMNVAYPAAVSTDDILTSAFGSFLRFEAAQDRAESALRFAFLNSIRTTLQESPDELDTLLDAWNTGTLFASAEGRSMLPLLLSEALESQKGDLFLSAFVGDPALATLAAFHPLVRDHARVLSLTENMTNDERMSLLLLTPLSDTQPQALSELAVRQWKGEWTDAMQSGDGTLLFSASLPILKTHIDRLDSLQYPERVDGYATAVLELAEPLLQGLSSDAQATLNAIRATRDARRSAAPQNETSDAQQTESSSSAPSESMPEVSNEALIAQVQALLLDAGFMKTAQTSFVSVGKFVQVSNIVVGTRKGDTTIAFTFDPARNIVSSIQKDGATLPYAISLEQLKEWLRQ